ncbi:hypothetical protein NQ318_018858 [Aromia moschata]|uniref:Helix-turn-helix domain-containing protein n=1 Tax=Aromia moschata TaxID=1265417 RepID=A0AAV8ZI21_9CUCU|nr:hypothetical protein NQ318_018858 [Aromia moschata]
MLIQFRFVIVMYQECKLSNETGNVAPDLAHCGDETWKGVEICLSHCRYDQEFSRVQPLGCIWTISALRCGIAREVLNRLMTAQPIVKPDDVYEVWLLNTRTDAATIALRAFVAEQGTRFERVEAFKAKATEVLNQLAEADFQHCVQLEKSYGTVKETATLRYIPNDSHHPFQHKMASFNFLIHRLLSFPLSKERFEHEKQLIKNIAKSNGYSVHLIDKLIRKHKFKRTLYNSTTFRRATDNSKFASLPYEPKFTRRKFLRILISI